MIDQRGLSFIGVDEGDQGWLGVRNIPDLFCLPVSIVKSDSFHARLFASAQS